MQKELDKLIYKHIKNKGAEHSWIGGGGYYIQHEHQFQFLVKEICDLYNIEHNMEFSYLLTNYIRVDLCNNRSLYNDNTSWFAEYIHKKIIELNLIPDSDNRGAASIMDTGLFDFKQK